MSSLQKKKKKKKKGFLDGLKQSRNREKPSKKVQTVFSERF
jgi:hypothetical protein